MPHILHTNPSEKEIKMITPTRKPMRPGYIKLQPNKVFSSMEEMDCWLKKQYPQGFELAKAWNSISCEVWLKTETLIAR